MQMLSQLDAQGDDALAQLDEFTADSQADPGTTVYVHELVRACWEGRSSLDPRIESQLQHWGMDRLSPVERNVIRVGLTELQRGEVPPKVVINEAVEIAREYGGAESPGFVNGIMDALWKADESAPECTSPGE